MILPSAVVKRVPLAVIRPCKVESAAANASPISFNVSNAPSALFNIASIRAVSVSMLPCNVKSFAARVVASVLIAPWFADANTAFASTSVRKPASMPDALVTSFEIAVVLAPSFALAVVISAARPFAFTSSAALAVTASALMLLCRVLSAVPLSVASCVIAAVLVAISFALVKMSPSLAVT